MVKKLLLLSLAALLFLAAWHYQPSRPACRVFALDVGQGDSILIQTADHQDILVDGGPDDSVLAGLNKYLPAGDRNIELMVLTHPHSDHVNGLVSVTERYTVSQVLETGVQFKQTAYQTWQSLLKQKNIPTIRVQAGQQYLIGLAQLDILWPVTDLSKTVYVHDNAALGGGINDTSIVMKLTCGGSRAILMGDASSDIEERIIASGVNIKADLLKVGHHGSRYSTSVDFVAAVQPKWAMISVGLNNKFNHPHPTSLLHLRQFNVNVFQTDQVGDVRYKSDGLGGWKRD